MRLFPKIFRDRSKTVFEHEIETYLFADVGDESREVFLSIEKLKHTTISNALDEIHRQV